MHKHWENPEVVGYGRLPARASFDRPDDQRILLDGTWKFLRVAAPDHTPANWTSNETEKWLDVTVPSLWTMDARIEEDKPGYTNVVMPFRNEPPGVPSRNPTGLYKRNVNVPETWLNDRIVIYIGGVECCYYLYCNGVEVGFSKDSKLPAEFDITDHLQATNNTIALKVIRYSDASFIEDQDQWWQAGIHRSIYLYHTPTVFIQDIFARPDYEPGTGRGRLDASVRIGGTDRSSMNHEVEIQLYPVAVNQSQGRVSKGLFKKPLAGGIDRTNFYAVLGQGPVINLISASRKVKPWTAETPNLYRLEISLKDPDGHEIDRCRLSVGFRDIRIENRELTVNGQPVLIRGVNRHDHNPGSGRIMTDEDLRLDIHLMKQHNINAIRTSHYPNDERFYQLCDELGMYVVDEANLESHHHYARLGKEPFWAGQFLSRGLRMVERDKNHACIIMWSVGNETGFGPNHMAMTAWIREYDPSRPVHNENAICEQGVRDRWEENRHGTDVICPMYPTVEAIINHAKHSNDPRPLIMCEYAHAMGNSCGNLTEYWDAVETWHGLQGGFIWEWKDHGITAEANGIEYWAYGGDFGEDRHDLNFVCDGLCWPDGTPHSSLIEYGKVIQPISVSHLKGQKFRLTNKHDFIDLRRFRVSWQLLTNGEITRRGKLKSFDTPAGYYEDFTFNPGRLDKNKENSVIFEFRVRRDEAWADAGHLIAWDQIMLTGTRPDRTKEDPDTVSSLVTTGSSIILEAGRSRITFSDNCFASWQFNARNIIDTAPLFNFWRAPMDNDGIKGWSGQDGKALGLWQTAGLDDIEWRHQLELDADTNKAVQVSRGLCPGGQLMVKTTYSLSNDAMIVEHQFEIPATIPDLPRVGVRWQLPGTLENLTWYGLGPMETYPDRKRSARLAIHQSTVSEQYVPYILPQEHGNLSDIRWLRLEDKALKLSITSHGELQASASRYPHEMLTPAFHTYELVPDNSIYLSLDAAQRGVGGASCGPDTLAAYRVGPGRYNLTYTIKAEVNK